MVPNGGMGFFSDVSQRPFVLGVIPVVGEPVSPLKWRLQRMAEQGASPGPGTSAVPDGDKAAGTLGLSSAERGDLSVAAIRAGQAADEDAKSAEIASLLEKARSLEDAGKPGVAKIYYKRAALRATGEQQQEIAGKIRELDKK